MKNISAITLTTMVMALVTVMPVRAQVTVRPITPMSTPPPSGEPAMFSGLVQGVDADTMQGIVTVRGPKPAAPSTGTPESSTSSTKSVIFVTKSFRLDRNSTITVAGKPKANISDLRNGDQVEIVFVPAPGGQGLVKSITDSGRPKKPTTKTNPPPQ